MSLSSDELNLLVYRYLQESGFVHAAFTFAYESLITKSNISNKDVPPGTLISMVQKGLQLIDIENQLNDDGTERFMSKDGVEKSVGIKSTEPHTLDSGVSGEAIQDEDVSVLRGHVSEVFICKWNPKVDILASGAGDSTSRLWHIPKGASGLPAGHIASEGHIVLNHHGDTDSTSKDVTSIDWKSDGTLFATGSYDGVARIWSNQGRKMSTLKFHRGPIFTLKFSPSGEHLLTGSVDKSVVLWNTHKGEVVRVYNCHSAPTLDVHWKDDTCFASCSSDKTINIYDVSASSPRCTLHGHRDEINAVRWHSSGEYVASASDDFSAKVWKFKDDGTPSLLHSFEHTKEIYTIQWKPTNGGTQRILASGSFDATVKLWDVGSGMCLRTLTGHTHPVYAISFSPCGKYIATGSFDQYVHVCSADEGTVLRRFRGGGGVFDLDWNVSGEKIAVSFSDNTLGVIDFRL